MDPIRRELLVNHIQIIQENNVEMNFDPERDPEIPHIERLKDQIKNKKNKKDENILVDEDVKDVRPLKKGLMERSI